MADSKEHEGQEYVQLSTLHVVIDTANDDDNRVLGQLRVEAGDTIEYIDTDGGIRSAPADCVAVVPVTYHVVGTY
jgi:hypothetical protein